MSRSVTRILLIICFIVLAAAVLISLKDVFAFTGYHYDNADKYTAGGSEINGTVRSLDIHWINGKVKVASHSGSTVLVSETSDKPITGDFQLRWFLDGDTLRIRFAKDGFRQAAWNNQQKELLLTLPEGISLNDVNMTATSADLAIPSLQADSLKLTTTSGDIKAQVSAGTISSASTSGDLDLTLSSDARSIRSTSTSGGIRIEGKNADLLEAVSTSGNIYITAENVGELKTTSTSGTVQADVAQMGNGQLSSTSGNISVKARKLDRLTVHATSGSIAAWLPAEPGFTANVKTTSGRFEYGLALSRSGSSYVCGDGSGSVTLQTTSGDVRIDPAQ